MLRLAPIKSLEQFLMLNQGDILLTSTGNWNVISQATKCISHYQVLVKKPTEEENQLIYFDEEKNVVLDSDLKTVIPELTSGIMHIRV